jgi:hypothetical protein
MAAVAQNHRSHGLSSKNFALLPNEDAAEYEALVTALEAEHAPATPTQSFLVAAMARAQWKLRRVAQLEAAILTPETEPTHWSAIPTRFRSDCSSEQALLKLIRYENSARRAWHQALTQLLKHRSTAAVARTARHGRAA